MKEHNWGSKKESRNSIPFPGNFTDSTLASTLQPAEGVVLFYPPDWGGVVAHNPSSPE